MEFVALREKKIRDQIISSSQERRDGFGLDVSLALGGKEIRVVARAYR